MYKYYHIFKDIKGEFIVMSNSFKKPNFLKAKFFPTYPDKNTKYVGVKNLEELKIMADGFYEDTDFDFYEDLEKWTKKHYNPYKNLCYFIPSQSVFDTIDLIKDMQSKGIKGLMYNGADVMFF